MINLKKTNKMINEQEYLKALEIVEQYNSENKKKVGRKEKIFSELEKTEKIIKIFENNSELKYGTLVILIQIEFLIGENKAKEILSEMVEKSKISKKGIRGFYFLNTTHTHTHKQNK